MGDFANVFDEFSSWKVTAAFYSYESPGKDAATNKPLPKVETLIGSAEVGFYTTTGKRSIVNDKPVDDLTSNIVVAVDDIAFNPNIAQYALIGSDRFYIESVDNVAMQSEIYVLKCRKEYVK
jgi:hypothetical protein